MKQKATLYVSSDLIRNRYSPSFERLLIGAVAAAGLTIGLLYVFLPHYTYLVPILGFFVVVPFGILAIPIVRLIKLLMHTTYSVQYDEENLTVQLQKGGETQVYVSTWDTLRCTKKPYYYQCSFTDGSTIPIPQMDVATGAWEEWEKKIKVISGTPANEVTVR